MDKITTKKINRWMKQFQRKLNKKYSPSRTILFGSRAGGSPLITSDIDIIIVSDKFRGVKWPVRLADVSELWDGLIPLEPLCYTSEEFEMKRKQLGIVKKAVEEGQEI